MKIGMTLPSMVEGLDRDTVLTWCRRIDDGPFSTLAIGERIGYPNIEMFTTLAAAAAVTQRVNLMTTIVVLPAHPAIEVAKMAATIDVISGGRLQLGVGIGGRGEDYLALERSDRNRHQLLDDQVAMMQRVWSGRSPAAGISPVGPAPVQPGGPPLYSGALGPKATARAAKWAEGIAGFLLDPIGPDHAATFGAVEAAWQNAGRDDKPRHVTSFWYSLADDGADRLHAYATKYLGVFGPDVAKAMADICTASSGSAVRDAIDQLDAAGCDELILVPTSADLDELDRLVELIT